MTGDPLHGGPEVLELSSVPGFVVFDLPGAAESAGGTRLAPDVSVAEVALLARAMTYKFAALGEQTGVAQAIGIRGRWPRVRRRLSGEQAFAYTLVTPTLLYIAALLLYPLALALWFSLSTASVGDPTGKFIGLDNFVNAWHNEVFREALRNSFEGLLMGGIGERPQPASSAGFSAALGQAAEAGLILRPAAGGDELGRPPEVERSPWISQPLPEAKDVVAAGGGAGVGCGPAVDEPLPTIHHPVHLGLLQHHLADQHLPAVLGVPPGQVMPARGRVPAGEPAGPHHSRVCQTRLPWQGTRSH